MYTMNMYAYVPIFLPCVYGGIGGDTMGITDLILQASVTFSFQERVSIDVFVP